VALLSIMAMVQAGMFAALSSAGLVHGSIPCIAASLTLFAK
jgi:hypothetical protein